MNERLAGYKLTDAQNTLLPLLKEEIGEQAEMVAAMLQPLTNSLNKQEVEVERGAYGIFEPKHSLINSGELLPLLNPSIVLVPGAAFDERGMRIGMGGGYYDRYLADFGGVSIGLCYSQCLAEILVGGIYDRCVDMVICPDVTLDMRRNGQNKNFS